MIEVGRDLWRSATPAQSRVKWSRFLGNVSSWVLSIFKAGVPRLSDQPVTLFGHHQQHQGFPYHFLYFSLCPLTLSLQGVLSSLTFIPPSQQVFVCIDKMPPQPIWILSEIFLYKKLIREHESIFLPVYDMVRNSYCCWRWNLPTKICFVCYIKKVRLLLLKCWVIFGNVLFVQVIFLFAQVIWPAQMVHAALY